MRAKRRRLTAAERESASRAICRQVRRLGAYRRAKSIAAYFAFDGEPNLEPLLAASHKQGKRLHAPVIRGGHMRFAAFDDERDLRRNNFGILEPTSEAFIDARQLDLVLTPLVAFDGTGVRIGVGGGYYDRCFGFLVNRRQWYKPHLIGIAFGFQEVPSIAKADWDVPLWGVATEESCRVFSRG